MQICDNLRGDGAVTRDAVVGLARLSHPAPADWIEARCSFPNAMLDCIAPAAGPAEIEAARALGVADAAPVTHENSRQRVIEDGFRAGRPERGKAGATVTGEAHAHDAMKTLVLNAGHQVLANAGELLGDGTIADCMAHPAVSPFWRKVEQDETAPDVAAMPGMTPVEYMRLIARRVANPAVHDTTRSGAFGGSTRHAGFVLPILRDALAAGAPVEGLALVEALWARMCAGRARTAPPSPRTIRTGTRRPPPRWRLEIGPRPGWSRTRPMTIRRRPPFRRRLCGLAGPDLARRYGGRARRLRAGARPGLTVSVARRHHRAEEAVR